MGYWLVVRSKNSQKIGYPLWMALNWPSLNVGFGPQTNKEDELAILDTLFNVVMFHKRVEEN